MTVSTPLPTLSRVHIEWMRLRGLWVLLSVTLCLLSVVALVKNGLNFGIDFRGGAAVEVTSPSGRPNAEALRQAPALVALHGLSVQNFGTESVLIRVGNNAAGDVQQVLQQLTTALQATDKTLIQRRTDTVGPKVGQELVWTGITALGSAIVAMALYVLWRFEGAFAIAAPVALAHDVLLTLGAMALLGTPFDLASVAALLTVIGFSMNDTVVIFDRIRENLRRHANAPLTAVVDVSINETLARTFVTSGTVLLSVLSLVVFGGEALYSFSWPVLCGIVVGTYSSVCVAAPLMGVLRPKK